MELEQLRQIDAVARTGTMSAAAAELHISQPALSRSIQRLEAEFGSPLFDREGRRVRLNEVGAVAVEWARQLLRDEALLREAVGAAAERAHALRVATVAPAPLWKLTGLAVERFPGETLTSDTLSQQEVERAVASGAADLGIVVGAADGTYTPPPGVVPCSLMRESLSVTLPPNHPLAARRKVTFEELDGNTFLILEDIGFWRAYVDRCLPSSTFIEQRDRIVFAQLARSTPHCTFTTDAPYLEGPLPGRVVVPIDDERACASFYLIVRETAKGVPAALFCWVSERA